MRDEEKTKSDWGKLFELLDTGLDLAAEKREPWINGLHDVPDSLKDRLRTLLEERNRFGKNAPTNRPAALQVTAVRPGKEQTRAADTAEVSHAPSVGTVIKGRYTLVEELGEGGMGRVFKARDERRVEAEDRHPYLALKVLSEDFKVHPDALIALQREGKRAQELAHPNVITVHDFDRDGPMVFMTMEYLQGKALDVLLRTDFAAGLSVAAAWPIIRGIGAALEYGHSKKIVHCDMKPSNVFLCRDGTVKVLDFGIARPMMDHDPNGEATRFDPGKRLGGLTPAYASLEMWTAEAPDPRDDIYAFACVMYQLLAGKHPYGGESARTVRDGKLTPKRIASLTRGQWDALSKGLAVRRETRIRTVAQLVAPFAPSSFLRRNGVTIKTAAVALAVVALAVGAHFYRSWVEDEMLDQSDAPTAQAGPPLTSEQKRDVADKLSLAQEFFEGVQLTQSADEMVSALSEGANNVNQILDDVLQVDPTNESAQALRTQIADLYARKAHQLQDARDIPGATLLVNAGLRVRPQNKDLFRMRRDLCKANPGAAECSRRP